jgi:hypothetical protein
MGSRIDLMVYYVKKMYTKKPNDVQRNQIITTITNALDNGYSERDIKLIIDKHGRNYGRETDITKVIQMEGKKPTDDVNLLKQDKFYYHSELRIVPGPPVTKYNPETKDFTRKQEDYYLELKASFTMSELIDYYCDTMKIKKNDANIKRFEAVFKSLLGSYKLDLILFTIDAAADIRTENHLNPLINPFNLTDYMNVGEQNFNLKVSLSKQEGVDQIVYKKREALF